MDEVKAAYVEVGRRAEGVRRAEADAWKPIDDAHRMADLAESEIAAVEDDHAMYGSPIPAAYGGAVTDAQQAAEDAITTLTGPGSELAARLEAMYHADETRCREVGQLGAAHCPDDDTFTSIASQLLALHRQTTGLTLAEVGRRIGISQASASRFVAGKLTPSRRTANAIFDFAADPLDPCDWPPLADPGEFVTDRPLKLMNRTTPGDELRTAIAAAAAELRPDQLRSLLALAHAPQALEHLAAWVSTPDHLAQVRAALSEPPSTAAAHRIKPNRSNNERHSERQL